MSVSIHGWRPRAQGPIVWSSRVVVQPTIEPISIDELKALARIQNDDEDLVLEGFIRAARDRVERDTSTALLTQERIYTLDRAPGVYDPFVIPVSPLQAVVSVSATAVDGTVTVVDSEEYLVSEGALSLGDEGEWPEDLRAVNPWAVRVRVGYEDIEDIPPLLVHMVGLAATHFATAGRDVAVGASDHLATEMPMTYASCLESFRPVVMP